MSFWGGIWKWWAVGAAVDIAIEHHKLQHMWGKGRYTRAEVAKLLDEAVRRSPVYQAIVARNPNLTPPEIVREMGLNFIQSPEDFERKTGGIKWPIPQ